MLLALLLFVHPLQGFLPVVARVSSKLPEGTTGEVCVVARLATDDGPEYRSCYRRSPVDPPRFDRTYTLDTPGDWLIEEWIDGHRTSRATVRVLCSETGNTSNRPRCPSEDGPTDPTEARTRPERRVR